MAIRSKNLFLSSARTAMDSQQGKVPSRGDMGYFSMKKRGDVLLLR